MQKNFAYLGAIFLVIAGVGLVTGLPMWHEAFWAEWGILFYLALKWFIEPKGY